MDIIVRGDGNGTVKPDKVTLDISFYAKSGTYEEVLAKGADSVNRFVNELMPRYGFSKEDLKTRSFNIRKETKRNEATRVYELDGYSYNQSAKLEFDYDIQKVASMMEDISKMPDSPIYKIGFGIKDEKSYRSELLAKAYRDAEDKARAIAVAAGKELKRCEKVDFKSFGGDFTSSSALDSEHVGYAKRSGVSGEAKMGASASDTISNTFTPEDIETSETLYCLWVAE